MLAVLDEFRDIDRHLSSITNYEMSQAQKCSRKCQHRVK